MANLLEFLGFRERPEPEPGEWRPFVAWPWTRVVNRHGQDLTGYALVERRRRSNGKWEYRANDPEESAAWKGEQW